MKSNLSLWIGWLCASFCLPNVNAQVIWGYQAPVGQAAGEFQESFVEDTTAGNYHDSLWTALSISHDSGRVQPGAAFWTRTVVGHSQGAFYATGNPVLTSATATNGAAIFDSDFMDNAGLLLSFGTGIAPAVQRGALISPQIDLSGWRDSGMVVSFHLFYRAFDWHEFSLSVSTDNGVTWQAPIDIRNYLTIRQNVSKQQLLRLLLPNWTSGSNTLSQCRLKFTLEGFYYFAIVDDLSVELAPVYDLSIGRPDLTASRLANRGNIIRMGGNAYQSRENLGYNTRWSWGAKVINKGTKDILPSARPRLMCQVDVIDSITQIVQPNVYSDSIIYTDTIFAGERQGVILKKELLDLGFILARRGNKRYVVKYWVAQDGVDGSPFGDTITHSFVVIDGAISWTMGTKGNYLSKARRDRWQRRVTATDYLSWPDGDYYNAIEYGSVYYFSYGRRDDIKIDSIDSEPTTFLLISLAIVRK